MVPRDGPIYLERIRTAGGIDKITLFERKLTRNVVVSH